MYSFRLALKNVTARKSSVVIILFIAFAIALLALSNAIFDGTDSGMENTFVNSFTGSIIVRPQSEYPLSLFGDETPVTGELSKIPPLVPYTQVASLVGAQEGIAEVIPQISGAAMLNINNSHIGTALFGVYAEQYIAAMPGIELLQGLPYPDGEKGIMMNEETIKSVQEQTGTLLSVGDNIQLITSDGTSFTIRSVPLTGIYRYKVKNKTLERIALIDPATLRSLMGMQDVADYSESLKENETDLLGSAEEDWSLDDFFSDAGDFSAEESEGFNLQEIFAQEELTPEQKKEQALNSTAWSFLVCHTDYGIPADVTIKALNMQFRKNGWPVQAVNWRTGAGGTVSLVFYMRTIFNIGILLILATGFIVVNNTLTISALGRVCETGTLRALGANRRFVALQFFFETAILTVTAGILGCILGVALNALIVGSGIPINNMYLSQLFGGNTLTSTVTFRNLGECMLLSVVLAFIGWLYPVHVAMESNPVVAMRGQI